MTRQKHKYSYVRWKEKKKMLNDINEKQAKDEGRKIYRKIYMKNKNTMKEIKISKISRN